MGHSLMKAALAHGDEVTAVGWTEENKMEQMDRMGNSNCIGMLCDVRIRCAVEKVYKQSLDHWGKIDIIAK
jgi:NADP-dependent 3-hydroxy acid dehydrogenase YdfG